jgi:hypothetical protein
MKIRTHKDHEKRAEVEKRIRRALRMYAEKDKDGNRRFGIREVAQLHSLKYGQLRLRIHGGKDRSEAHRSQQLLSKTQEKALLRWIDDLEDAGFPPRRRNVREAGKLLVGRKPGKNWVTRFLNRHPELAIKFTTPLEKR